MMKRKSFKPVALLILMMVVSCDEPETVVTNYVHTDGSVTREVEMKSIEDKPEDRFQISDLQVPFDSSWAIIDSLELSEDVDTIWTRRAVKLFKNVEEINLTYKNDSGANREASRHSEFKKSFRWFNTEFRFSEIIDEKVSYGYPIRDFLNDEELLLFYSPEYVQESMKNGPDSLKYKAMNKSMEEKTEAWMYRNLIAAWIVEFSKLVEKRGGAQSELELLKSHEDELTKMLLNDAEEFDSLFSNGTILKNYLGIDNYQKYIFEADTAIEKASEYFWGDFTDYSVRIVMPGIVTGTNGFIDSSNVLLWPVTAEYFLSEPYEMWVESKIPNRWAWIVSGIFLAFVFTGVIIRVKKRG